MHTNMLYSIGKEKERHNEPKLLNYGVHLVYGGINYDDVVQSTCRME